MGSGWDESDMSLAEQVLEAFCDAAEPWRDHEDVLKAIAREAARSRKLERDREYQRMARIANRPKMVEVRTCPVCGKVFRNVFRQKGGRRRMHCSDKCRWAGVKRRARTGGKSE